MSIASLSFFPNKVDFCLVFFTNARFTRGRLDCDVLNSAKKAVSDVFEAQGRLIPEIGLSKEVSFYRILFANLKCSKFSKLKISSGIE